MTMKWITALAVLAAGVLTSGALTSSASAAAEPARFPVTLPNCPTPFIVNGPSLFAGARNDLLAIEAYAANKARQGTYVLALQAPPAPHLHLTALELGTIRSIQGNISQAQFDKLREFAMQQDPEVLARDKKYAQPLASGAKGRVEIKGMNPYSVSTNDHEVIILAVGRFTINETEQFNYLAMKMVYAHDCIIQVQMWTPVEAMPIETFEALVDEMSAQ